MQHRHVFGTTDGLAAELVRLMADAAARAIDARGVYTMALTGGSAAQLCYPVLAQAPLPWEKTHVFFGDERCVPADHADSNFALAHKALLSRVPIPQDHIHRIEGELAPAEAAARYQEVLRAHTDGVLDVVHLGMGPDGHVCSLFPGHALLQSKRLVDSLTDSPKPPAARVTLTLPCLAAARALFFLVAGSNKSDAVREVMFAPDSSLPAALASRAARDAHWLLDDAAAVHLKA